MKWFKNNTLYYIFYNDIFTYNCINCYMDFIFIVTVVQIDTTCKIRGLYDIYILPCINFGNLEYISHTNKTFFYPSRFFDKSLLLNINKTFKKKYWRIFGM